MQKSLLDYINFGATNFHGEILTPTVGCTSVPTFDGWTSERIGWMYGVHIIYKMPLDKKCPNCGVDLDDDRNHAT